MKSRATGTGLVVALTVSLACASPPPAEPIELDLAAAAAVTELAAVCPVERVDRVCSALRRLERRGLEPDDVREARTAVRDAFAAQPRPIDDPALHWWLRERGVALLAWNALRSDRSEPTPGAYASATSALLARHFPVYSPDTFRTARVPLSPGVECGTEQAALVFFPSVIRVSTRDVFDSARARIESEMPCVVTFKAETGTLATPATNARAGCATLAQIERDLPGASIHLVGYSQGVRNALETLVTCPENTQSVRTLFAMNSAAHGSPAADAVALILPLPGLEEARCAGLGRIGRWWCRSFGAPFAFGLSSLVGTAVLALGGPDEDADGAAAGLRTLSTYESREFWRTKASGLPTDLLFVSFRSIITDEDQNLPASNRLFYRSVFLAGGTQPWSDMQVRLLDQRLGGPLAEREVVWPVAEGNHWQWHLEPHQLPGIAMPASMLEGIPREELLLAHLQTLAEVGLLVAARPPDR